MNKTTISPPQNTEVSTRPDNAILPAALPPSSDGISSEDHIAACLGKLKRIAKKKKKISELSGLWPCKINRVMKTNPIRFNNPRFSRAFLDGKPGIAFQFRILRRGGDVFQTCLQTLRGGSFSPFVPSAFALYTRRWERRRMSIQTNVCVRMQECPCKRASSVYAVVSTERRSSVFCVRLRRRIEHRL